MCSKSRIRRSDTVANAGRLIAFTSALNDKLLVEKETVQVTPKYGQACFAWLPGKPRYENSGQ